MTYSPAQRPVVKVAYTAQNARTRGETIKVKAACGKKKAAAKRRDR